MYIPEDKPIPDMKDPEYIPAVAREVVKLVKETHGHTAVLFPSYKALNVVFELVRDELKDYPLIKMSRSNKTAITQFKNSENGVLFASGSMWEGVDCAGDILSSVIIVRLPFPLRSQTMEFKKSNCESTKEFVQKYAVPQMIMKLRQGAGRLIRNNADTGVLAILDARAAKGRCLPHPCPECPAEIPAGEQHRRNCRLYWIWQAGKLLLSKNTPGDLLTGSENSFADQIIQIGTI